MKDRVVGPGFRAKVYARVRQVPSGFVTTYGDVATVLGAPNVARHVGWALSALPADTDVPWHRVVNAKAQISFRSETERGEEQHRRLLAEGIQISATGRIDFRAHRFDWGNTLEVP